MKNYRHFTACFCFGKELVRMIANFLQTGILLCRIDLCSIICLTGHHSGKQKNIFCNTIFAISLVLVI